MFTLFWTYVSFSQLVIIWSGNLPEEITWYIDRMNGGWEYIGAILLFLQWMLPFLILLSQTIKRNPTKIRTMAIWILCVRLADTIWLVEPNFHSQHLYISWSDLTAPIGLTGLWAAIYLWQLKKRALIPVNAPDLRKGFGPWPSTLITKTIFPNAIRASRMIAAKKMSRPSPASESGWRSVSSWWCSRCGDCSNGSMRGKIRRAR